jgi:putative selenium metabolism protein SsnA
MPTLLIQNGIIITLGESNKVLYDHAVLIENGTIKKVSPRKEFSGKYDKVIDAKGKVVMPGFINVHMHFYSTLVRGLGKAKPSKDFVEVLNHLWWKLDKALRLEDCYYSALIMMMNAIRHGTTTFIDHHASPMAVRGSLMQIAKASKETGLRSCLCYELSDRDGEKIAQEGLDENSDFIRYCNDNKDDYLKALFGLHASFTICDKTLERAARLGHDLKAGFHVHTAEAESDQEYNMNNFGLRVVERFHKFGILGPHTIAAHCTHVNDKEIELLAGSNTMVAHNAQSNQNNAVGIADIVKLQQKGILVGLGTDAMTVNMTEELRVAMWGQHLRHNNPSCGFMEVASTLLYNNARIANRIWNLPLGEIKAGAVADVILLDYYPPTPLNEQTFLGHIVFGISQCPVDTTIVNGKVLMEEKKLTIPVDEEKIAARARELTVGVWDRF